MNTRRLFVELEKLREENRALKEENRRLFKALATPDHHSKVAQVRELLFPGHRIRSLSDGV